MMNKKNRIFVLAIVITLSFLIVWMIFWLNRDLITDRPYFSTTQRTDYSISEPFYFDLRISSEKAAINLVDARLKYDISLLEVVSIDTQKSLSSIFLSKEFDNSTGNLSIVGGLPNPGVIGNDMMFARILFRAKQTGSGKLTLLPESQIFANDGEGTNLLNDFASFTITVVN